MLGEYRKGEVVIVEESQDTKGEVITEKIMLG